MIEQHYKTLREDDLKAVHSIIGAGSDSARQGVPFFDRMNRRTHGASTFKASGYVRFGGALAIGIDYLMIITKQ